MITRSEYHGIPWVDIENPSGEEIAQIREEFEISSLPFLATQNADDARRGFVEAHEHYLLLTLPVPVRLHCEEDALMLLTVALGKDFLITVHDTSLHAASSLRTYLEEKTNSKRVKKTDAVPYLFAHFMHHLYIDVRQVITNAEDTVRDIERALFTGNEKEMVVHISNASRDLLTYRHSIERHTELIERIEHACTRAFGESATPAFERILTQHQHTLEQVFSLGDVLEELRETNMALLTTKQNEIMKNLTIMAFVTFPLSLIAGIFGMNTLTTPIVGSPYDFYIIVGGMFMLTFLFFVYFKVNRWF